jgi:hypothetical protein
MIKTARYHTSPLSLSEETPPLAYEEFQALKKLNCLRRHFFYTFTGKVSIFISAIQSDIFGVFYENW